MGKTLSKDSKGHLDIRNVFACHTSSFKSVWKKEKVKVSEPKTLIPSSQMQKTIGGEKLGGRLERDQIAHL